MRGEVDLPASVRAGLLRHPHVRAVDIVGSRADGVTTRLSDWDFRVDAVPFASVAADLPALVATLDPLAQQWDRLNPTWCYMLLLTGPVKVDLIFDEPHHDEPPWTVNPGTLAGIDRHFWDWILWLASKRERGQHGLVGRELMKMSGHLLRPMGIDAVPPSITAAIQRYRQARDGLEVRLGTRVSRRLEAEVLPAVNGH